MRARRLATRSEAVLPRRNPVTWVGIGACGVIVAHSDVARRTFSFTLDGRMLCEHPLHRSAPLLCAVFSEDGHRLLMAFSEPKVIFVVDTFSLRLVMIIGLNGTRRFENGAWADQRLPRTFAGEPVEPFPSPRADMRAQRTRSGVMGSAAAAAAAAMSGGIPGNVATIVTPFAHPVTSMAFTRAEKELVVGLRSGEVLFYRGEFNVISDRLESRLEEHLLLRKE